MTEKTSEHRGKVGYACNQETDDSELSLEKQARMIAEHRRAETETGSTPPERLTMKLREIVNDHIGDDLATERELKLFAKEHALSIGVIRKVARDFIQENESRKQVSRKTGGGVKARHHPIEFKVTSKGRPQAIVFNALQVFRHDQRWQGVFGYDEFAECAMLLNRPPYDHKGGDWTPRPLQDSDDIEAADWMQGEFDLPVSSGMVAEATQVAARYNRYHPIRDYLNSLTWDGTPRLDAWLINYFGAENTDYIKAVSSKTLIAAVARILRPGCKVDTVLILDSPQGYLKSTALRVLAGSDWFTDHMPDLHSKDAMQQLSGKWIIELAELSALSRSDIEATKRFITSRQDDFRPAYGRRKVSLPRQCIFVGTTNETLYLKDSTGNRRFWPVSVTKRCDMAHLKNDRDQLWAEAVHRFNQGEHWHLTAQLEQKAAEAQKERIEPDEWESPIMKYLDDRSQINFVTSGYILENVLGIEAKDWATIAQKRVSSILKRNNWKHKNKRVDGVPTKGFMRPMPHPPTQPGPGNKDVTDVTDIDNPVTDSGNVKNSSNINHVTDVTDVTGTYKDRQQLKRGNGINGDVGGDTYSALRTLRYKKSTGNTGYTGNTVDSKGVLGFSSAVTPTVVEKCGNGNSSCSSNTEPHDQDDGYIGSLVSEYARYEPVAPDTDHHIEDATTHSSGPAASKPATATVLATATVPVKLSRDAQALERLLAEYRGFEQAALLAKRLRWEKTRVLGAAHELEKLSLARVANGSIKSAGVQS